MGVPGWGCPDAAERGPTVRVSTVTVVKNVEAVRETCKSIRSAISNKCGLMFHTFKLVNLYVDGLRTW